MSAAVFNMVPPEIQTALQGWTVHEVWSLARRTTRNSFHGSFRQQPFADFLGVREKEEPFRAKKDAYSGQMSGSARNI